MGNGVSLSHCFCHFFMLRGDPYSRVGSFPQENISPSAMQIHSTVGSFLWTTPMLVPFAKCSSTGAGSSSMGLLEQPVPVGLPRANPVSKSTLEWAPFCPGSQLLPGAYSSMYFSWYHSLFWVHPPASPWSSSRTA